MALKPAVRVGGSKDYLGARRLRDAHATKAHLIPFAGQPIFVS